MKKIWQNKRINFIGDSITFGAGSTICYSDILKENWGLEKQIIMVLVALVLLPMQSY